jgi:hypothetical protein
MATVEQLMYFIEQKNMKFNKFKTQMQCCIKFRRYLVTITSPCVGQKDSCKAVSDNVVIISESPTSNFARTIATMACTTLTSITYK